MTRVIGITAADVATIAEDGHRHRVSVLASATATHRRTLVSWPCPCGTGLTVDEVDGGPREEQPRPLR